VHLLGIRWQDLPWLLLKEAVQRCSPREFCFGLFALACFATKFHRYSFTRHEWKSFVCGSLDTSFSATVICFAFHVCLPSSCQGSLYKVRNFLCEFLLYNLHSGKNTCSTISPWHIIWKHTPSGYWHFTQTCGTLLEARICLPSLRTQPALGKLLVYKAHCPHSPQWRALLPHVSTCHSRAGALVPCCHPLPAQMPSACIALRWPG